MDAQPDHPCAEIEIAGIQVDSVVPRGTDVSAEGKARADVERGRWSDDGFQRERNEVEGPGDSRGEEDRRVTGLQRDGNARVGLHEQPGGQVDSDDGARAAAVADDQEIGRGLRGCGGPEVEPGAVADVLEMAELHGAVLTSEKGDRLRDRDLDICAEGAEV